jgi:RecA-family ATPase
MSTSEPLALRRAEAVRHEVVEWLWPGWVARGVLTLLDGDPGLGKSTLALELAARLSRQGLASMVLSAEDDPARVIRPRLAACDADLARVLIVDGIGADARPVQVPGDLPHLAAAVRAEHVALVIVDPLMAFLARGVAAHSDQHVRRALHRLKRLAEQAQCAVLLIRHLNKAPHLPALYRGGGSIGILGACRTALLVGKDPADEQARVLAMNKTNLGLPPRSLRYRLETAGEVSRLRYDGECAWTAQDLLSRIPEAEVQELSRLDECADWLRRLLLEKGPLLSFDLECQAKMAGYAQRTVDRARKLLGVKARRRSFTWEAYLPENPGTPEETRDWLLPRPRRAQKPAAAAGAAVVTGSADPATFAG